MIRSTPLPRRTPYGPSRSLVLGTALALALVAWLAPRMPVAQAQDSKPPAVTAAPAPPAAPAPAEPPRPQEAKPKPGTGKDSKGVTIRIETDAPPARAGDPAHATASDDEPDAAVHAPRHGSKVRVLGIQSDREYDSFNELIDEEPWIGVLIFWCVTLAFVTPLLIAIAVVWYKVRKTRMVNETMLKLAEKGVVPPGEAMEAMALGKPAAAMATGAPGGALYEQARKVRRRVAWSDLRKGVVLGGIGAALVLASIINDGEANGFGLVLLFVGIGYGVLWWFEERQTPAPNGSPDGSPPAA
jgi:hypothetical protein